MRQFRVEPRILASEVFHSRDRGWHRAMVRARAEDYIGGGGQIIDFSADGGLTWIRVANFTPTIAHTARIAYDGVDTYVIFCGTTVTTNDGTFRSINDGVSFARVTGITGFDFTNDICVKLEYGTGSKLWNAVEAEFGDHGEIISSGDDGSSWDVERADGGDGLWTFMSNAAGIMFLDPSQSSGAGIFDADGAGLGAPTADFIGLGASWVPYGVRAEFCFADANSVKSSRFFAHMYNPGSDFSRVYYSDDNGTTWTAGRVLDTGNESWSSTTATESHWMWDGTNYHLIMSGATDYWYWSTDGSLWSPAPQHGNVNLTAANMEGLLCTAEKSP